jgi:hypothetical protein
VFAHGNSIEHAIQNQKRKVVFWSASQPLMSIKKQFCRESGKERDWRFL